MNFFKSVFADDPDPSGTESESDSPKHTDQNHENPHQSSPNNNEEEHDGGWSFGGLMKTLATRSESVIETYRRDLEEFGTGLKKEIEVAQGSLGNVGHAIDELGNTVLKSTAEIIAQGKEAILAAGNESDSSDNNNTTSIGRRDSFSSKPYSRFDAQVRFVQSDVNTYCEEPEDSDDYKKWESEFVLDDEKVEEMERLFEENGDMKGVYKRVVPSLVDHESFWFRYFYKVYKVKQAEDLRANLVKRARSLEDEEELSWDIDDDEENEKVIETSRLKLEGNDEARSVDSVTEVSKKKEAQEVKTVVDSAPPASDNAPVVVPASDKAPTQDSGKPESVPESDKAATSQDSGKPVVESALARDSGKPKAVPESDKAATSQDSGKPVVESAPVQDSSKSEVASSTQQQSSEEDLGWDEIEDMSSIDGGGGGKEVVVAATRSGSGGSPDRAELRKRLSAATEEEDEDLSWDIEDDDDEEESSNKA